jgi:hypothetical protein
MTASEIYSHLDMLGPWMAPFAIAGLRRLIAA